MPIAEDTRRLCDEIFSFHLALSEGVADRQRSVGQSLKEARNSHFQMGKELRASLAEDDRKRLDNEQQRLDSASEFASTLAAEGKQRTRDVGRMLGGFRKELAGFHKENKQRAAAVREFLGDVREDMLAAGAAWRGLAGRLSRPFSPAPPKPGPKGTDKERRILNVVMGHPRGLKLTDIGKRLGADWRSLNAPTRNLLTAGKLRKINNLYFAV